MKCFLVGGAVRNKLLGLPVKDKDWVVVGSSPQELLSLNFTQVAKAFPVFLHPVTHEEYALARRESKTSKGYHGFVCEFSPRITLEEDLARRDFTINAIAEDSDGKVYDPYGGLQDLHRKVIRHVGPSFVEDPLRVIRGARFYASLYDLSFNIDTETIELMKAICSTDELTFLSPERIYKEFQKAFEQKHPAIFIKTLQKVGVFTKILKGLSMTREEDLQRVDSCLDKNVNIVFATLLMKNPGYERVLKDIRSPTYLMKLTAAVYEMQNYQQQASEELLAKLKKYNLLRDESIAQSMVKIFDNVNIPTTKIKSIIEALKSMHFDFSGISCSKSEHVRNNQILTINKLLLKD